MNLDHLKEELDEFEDFVNNYTKQMADVLSGKDIPDDKTKPMPKSPLKESFLCVREEDAVVEPLVDSVDTKPVKQESQETLMVEPIQTRNAATAAESELKTTKNPCIIKAPKTSLDYSRFEKIGDDADDPEPVPPTPTVAQPAASKKTEISTEPKPKPYSLKTNAKNFKTVEEKLLEIANQHKILGNEAIRVSDPISAIKHYTDAIETCLHPKRQQITEYESKEKSKRQTAGKNSEDSPDPFGFLDRLKLPDPESVTPEPSIYSNRAYARLCVLDFPGALEDCNAVLNLPENSVSDQIRIKTLWRRSLVYHATDLPNLAKDDLASLTTTIKTVASCSKSEANSPVAQHDVDRLIRICEQQIYDESGDQSLKEAVDAAVDKVDLNALISMPMLDLSLKTDLNTSIYLKRKSFETLFARLSEGILLRLREIDSSANGAPNGRKLVVIIESISIKSYSDALVELLEDSEQEPASTSIFRLFGGFEKMFHACNEDQVQRSIISPSSIHYVLPVLLAAVVNSETNQRQLATHNRLVLVMKSVLESPLVFSTAPTSASEEQSTRGIQLISQAAKLLSVCAFQEAVLFNVITYSNLKKEFSQVWELFMKTALDMLNHTGNPDPKRIHPALPSATPAIASDIFNFISKFLQFMPSGVVALFSKWGCTSTILLEVLDTWIERASNMNKKQQSGAELTISAVSECLTNFLDVGTKTKLVNIKLLPLSKLKRNKIVRNLVAIVKNPCQPDQPNEKALVCLHNWIAVCSEPFDDAFLVECDFIPALVRYLGKYKINQTTSATSVALATFAKLQARNPQQAAKDLDGWWDEIGLHQRLTEMSLLMESGTTKATGQFLDDAGNWTQLLAGWLQQNRDAKEQNRVVLGWKQEGGFEAVLELVKALLGIAFEKVQDVIWLEKLDRFIGNVGLVLAECLKREDHGKYFHNAGLTDYLVDLLRIVSKRPPGQKSAQKNISIACARLCQYEAARDRVRELQGMELLYNLGSKVVQ